MIPSGYSKNVLSGTLPGGEIFATAFWCNEAPSDDTATQAQADNFAGEFNTAVADTGSPVSFLSSQGQYTDLTVYSYLDDTGKATYSAVSPITGGSGTGNPTMPNQVAIVATLLTGLTGRRRRGRMYFPCLSTTLTNGQASALPNPFATWLANYFTACNSHLGSAASIVVLSQVGGDSRHVTAISVDTRLDIQRRRADRETVAGSFTAPVSTA
jgi:hypothetical protein